MTRTVAEVMVDVLISAGARRCYGVPGDTLNYFTDAVRRSTLRWVHVRHEEAGAMAAGADALLTGELALCAGSCGPGSLHFMNGVWESNRNRAPVVLIASQLPRDELGFEFPQEVDSKAAAPDEPEFAVHRAAPVIRPSDAELDRIATALNAGNRIAIYGGSGCAKAHDQVVALAERLKAPVARTSRAKDFLAYDNPYDVSMTGVFGTKGGYHALTECDTLLLLGCDFAWRQFYPQGATIIQIDVDGAHLGRRHPVDIAAVGDIAPTLEALLPRVQERADRSFLDESLARARHAEERLERRAVPGHGAVHPQYLVETIAAHAAPDAIYTADGGSPMVWCLRHVPSTGANRTILSLSHGTMANAMPQALGAQAAFPGRQVISLSGDGGLAMLMGDLLTTVQEKLPIKVAVFNNGALQFVELEQKVEGLLDTYTDLNNPNFARVAEAIGLWARRIEAPAALEDGVREWLEAPGPALLDVVVARNELVMPPKVAVSQVLGTALYSAKAILSGRTTDVIDLAKGALTT